jgi:hypothetical protein
MDGRAEEGADKAMNEDDKKLLTEFLEECWHKLDIYLVCVRCGRTPCFPEEWKAHRTFTTWQDLGDLKEKLVEKGMWKEFLFFYADIGPVDPQKTTDWFDHLLNPTVFIPLCVEFLGKEKI